MRTDGGAGATRSRSASRAAEHRVDVAVVVVGVERHAQAGARGPRRRCRAPPAGPTSALASVERTTTRAPRRSRARACATSNPRAARRRPCARRGRLICASMAVRAEVVQQLEAGRGRVGVRHRRRPGFEPPRARRPVERVEAERKRVDAAEPAGRQRLEPLDERAAHVEERDAGRTEQVLQRAGHQEVDAERVHVERRRCRCAGSRRA